MKHELIALNKLIERKKSYLQNSNYSPKAIDAIKAEITILENAISAIKNDEKIFLLNQLNKQIQQMQDTIVRFESICILHGINDYPVWLNKDTSILMGQIKEIQKLGMLQVPVNLQNTFKA